MLTALVLTLEPTVTATLPAFLGRAIHAWFLDEVRRSDPHLAQALHGAGRSKPFTVSSLECQSSRLSNSNLRLSAGQTCHLRITSLEMTLSQYLVETLAPSWLSAHIHLCGVPFRISDVTCSTAGHPRAARVSYDAIIKQTIESAPPKSIALRFVSPTVFRRTPPRGAPFGDESYNLPFPLPELVFGGLLDTWNTFSPEPIDGELLTFARDCVVVSRYNLHTELVEFGSGRRGRVGGYEGLCRFFIRCKHEVGRREIGLLAAFSPFAGVGWRKTMGLGQVQFEG